MTLVLAVSVFLVCTVVLCELEASAYVSGNDLCARLSHEIFKWTCVVCYCFRSVWRKSWVSAQPAAVV